MQRHILLWMVAFFLFGTFSHAVKAESYFKGTLGYSIGGDGEATVFVGSDSVTDSEDFDSKILNPITLAYGWSMTERLGMEVEFSIRKFEYESGGSGDGNSLGLNLIVNLAKTEQYGLYAGLGFLITQYNMGLDGVVDELSGDEIGFSGQLIVGMNFQISDTIKIGPELRYFSTLIKPEWEYSAADVTLEGQMKQYSLGFVFQVAI